MPAPTWPQVVDSHLKPHWAAALEGADAETMQAVPDMLGACGPVRCLPASPVVPPQRLHARRRYAPRI